MNEVVIQRTIRASAATIFELFTNAELLAQWMADAAAVDAVVGGEWRWTHANGDSTAGRFVELIRNRRIVFTYGWEPPELGIPPGSTMVEIDLTEIEGRTRVRVVHRGLDAAAAQQHRGGWAHYLGRLTVAAERGDPGPDPLTGVRADGSPARVGAKGSTA